MSWATFKISIKEKWEFIKYITSEPVREFKKLILSIFDRTQILNLPKTWIPIYGVFAIFALIVLKDISIAIGMLVLTIITFIFYEWEKGDWKHHYRKKIYNKLKNEGEMKTEKNENT